MNRVRSIHLQTENMLKRTPRGIARIMPLLGDEMLKLIYAHMVSLRVGYKRTASEIDRALAPGERLILLAQLRRSAFALAMLSEELAARRASLSLHSWR